MKIRLLTLVTLIAIGTSCSSEKSIKPDPSPSSENLDLLLNYDKELWSGPDGWTKEQWQWKKKLRWDKHCDYVADIEVYKLEKNRQLIQVMCVPGAYQPMQYLFLYHVDRNLATQLELGAPASTDNPKEIFGHIVFDNINKQLSILTLSRGTRDCGLYRVYDFQLNTTEPKLVDHRARACSETPLPENLSEDIFNPTLWPTLTK